jgi:hypothetical protein
MVIDSRQTRWDCLSDPLSRPAIWRRPEEMDSWEEKLETGKERYDDIRACGR